MRFELLPIEAKYKHHPFSTSHAQVQPAVHMEAKYGAWSLALVFMVTLHKRSEHDRQGTRPSQTVSKQFDVRLE
jgi:hypothetical protein